MTRHVNFSSGQRVDLIDMQAMREFRNQDLRRIMRQVIIGRDLTTRVIWGFKVEPENPSVSPKILIKMNQGGGNIGSFMGAENYGSVPYDFGQVAGGRDAQNSLDGSAQMLVDLTGQPVGTYEVKVRFTFVEGVSDNRAFWNPATNAEFIKATNTRLLPQWEAAVTGHAGLDWVLLAEVDWNGVSVDYLHIVDKRDLALEGKPRAEVLPPLQWSHPDQESAADYGVGDFDRGGDRSDPDIIRSGIWQMVRALARQVQDIKGPRDIDGRYDWYSRPHQPYGFFNNKPEEHTKSLRTIDTVTFTIGDGLTEVGDFNGATGLVDCMEFIQDYSASLPSRIRIVLKSKSTTPSFPVLTWNKNIIIHSKHIEIEGLGNGSDLDPYIAELDGYSDGQTLIGVSVAAGTTALHMTGNGGLYLKHLWWGCLPFADVNIITTERSCLFQASNTWLLTTGNAIALRCASERCYLDNCVLTGIVFIGGKNTPITFNRDYDVSWRGGLVRNSAFLGCLVALRNKNFTFGDDAWLFANRLRFENCVFVPRGPLYLPNYGGMVDARGARNITFEGCHVQYSGDEDGLRLGSLDHTTGIAPSRDIAIKSCQFTLRDSCTHLGRVHTGGVGGVNGLEGTGWAIKSHPGFVPTDPAFHIPRNIVIEDCEFRCSVLPSAVVSSPDAGAILIMDSRNVHVRRNRVVEWTAPIAGSTGDFVYLINAAASAGGYTVGAGQDIHIDDNYVGQWWYPGSGAAWGAGTLTCIAVSICQFGSVSRNVISAIDMMEVVVADPALVGAAMGISACNSMRIEDNQFILWRSTADPLNNTALAIFSINNALFVNRNHFYGCGGYNIFGYPASTTIENSQFNGNVFNYGNDATKFSGAISLLNCTTQNNHFHNNYHDKFSGTVVTAIHVGNGVRFSVQGNHFLFGNIVHATLGGVPSTGALGYGSSAAHSDAPNVVAGYL